MWYLYLGLGSLSLLIATEKVGPTYHAMLVEMWWWVLGFVIVHLCWLFNRKIKDTGRG